jgi:hypothetical protein
LATRRPNGSLDIPKGKGTIRKLFCVVDILPSSGTSKQYPRQEILRVTLRGCSPDMERMKSRYMARHEARQQTYAGVLTLSTRLDKSHLSSNNTIVQLAKLRKERQFASTEKSAK